MGKIDMFVTDVGVTAKVLIDEYTILISWGMIFKVKNKATNPHS